MNEQEAAKSLLDNFSISDVVALLSMLGAIVAAIISWINKRKAAKSEEDAARYAKNADEANQAIKRYYDEMHEHFKKQSELADRNELKKKILIIMDSGSILKLSVIAENVGITVEEANELFNELNVEGHRFYRHHTQENLENHTLQIKR